MRRAPFIATSLVTAVVVAGCGGGSSKPSPTGAGSAAAQRVLAQTFDGHHPINSGVIAVNLTVVPNGSSSISGPVELSFGGPFTDQGVGKQPESDFTIAISAEGHRAALQMILAGGKGYITVGGQSYRLPGSSYRSFESGFGSLTSAGGGSSSKSAGLKLGIKPLKWLVRPRIAGHPSLDGTPTTEVRAGLDASAMLRDFSSLLGKLGSLGVSGTSSLPHSIAAATQRSIARALGSPSVEVWTGTSDKLIRKLAVSATVPITGQAHTELGGIRSAAITLGFGYSHVNQPQTIQVPTETKPYSVFRTEALAVLDEIVSGSLTSGTSTTGSGGSVADQKYTQCITSAAGDVAKMQKCSKLLATG